MEFEPALFLIRYPFQLISDKCQPLKVVRGCWMLHPDDIAD